MSRRVCQCHSYGETKEKHSKPNAGAGSWMDGVPDGDAQDQGQQVGSSPGAVSIPPEKADDVLVAIHHSGPKELTHDYPDEREVIEPSIEAVQKVVAEFCAEDQRDQEGDDDYDGDHD
jgi:hypothetical protein